MSGTALTASEMIDQALLAFPAGDYCLPSLLRVLEIVASREVPTACVETALHPRMLINPDFVAAHAGTPEKLLMLILHELHHIVLGHTRACPRVTPLDNLVFDAVINSMLCRTLHVSEYAGLVCDFYRDDRFPECFLRPASGWRADRARPPVPPALRTPELEHLGRLHRALYSCVGVSYSDLREALAPHVETAHLDGITLLGDHRPSELRDGELADAAGLPILLEELEAAVRHWPEPPSRRESFSVKHAFYELRIGKVRASRQEQLSALIRRVFKGRRGTSTIEMAPRSEGVISPIPRPDRRSVVLTALGRPPLLHQYECPRRRASRVGSLVHVYFDVSFSMRHLIRPLCSAILGCRRLVHPKIHLFSTRVFDVYPDDLETGCCPTMGGTDFCCVAEHVAEHGVRRAVILTDGEFARLSSELVTTMRGLRLGLALSSPRPPDRWLTDLADATVFLTNVNR